MTSRDAQPSAFGLGSPRSIGDELVGGVLWHVRGDVLVEVGGDRRSAVAEGIASQREIKRGPDNLWTSSTGFGAIRGGADVESFREDDAVRPRPEDFGPEWTRQEIARLRYTKSTGVWPWTLYWPDRNSRFHRYEDLEPTPTIDRLLAEVDADPICIFWG